MTGLFGPDAMFAFKWQVALHGEPLSDAEMRQLATAASPVLKLRGAWTVVDPQVARKAKKRLIRTITPVQAVAAALTGTVEVEEGEAEVIVGASLLKVRERLLGAATRDPLEPPAGAAGDAARLPAARADLARPADHARARLLPGRRHGARQDHHR